ncbi:hypothetical protein V1524DRAFT_375209 [Lipomyces starkeyi]
MSATLTAPSLTVTPTSSAVVSPPASSSSSSTGGPTISPATSPLLFFVALGFGIVFTNLWIIVGVKYCFRRNRRLRARALAANGEIPYDGYDETGYDMGLLRPPIRRRREKKLMTNAEMDERFPVKKYKVWRCERESAGLPTEGGVAAQIPSRAPSVREIDLEIGAALKEAAGHLEAVDIMASTSEGADHNDHTTTEQETVPHPESASPGMSDLRRTDSAKSASASDLRRTNSATMAGTSDLLWTNTATTAGTSDLQRTISGTTAETLKPQGEEEDDEDAVLTHPNLHPDLADTSGDACAICLEQLEDDDDVRGLSCGHAFHAACIDPWLTTRRACCPLCKADYYVPKQILLPQPAQHHQPDGHSSRGVLPDQYASFFRAHGLTGFPVVRHNETDELPPPATSPNMGERNENMGSTWASRFVRARLPRSRRHGERASPEEQTVATDQPGQVEMETSPNEQVDVERQEAERQRQEAEYRQSRERSYGMNVNLGIHGAVI